MKMIRYLNVLLVLITMPAVADDANMGSHAEEKEESLKEVAIIFAECSGRFEARADHLTLLDSQSTALAARENARDFEAAAWVAFSRTYDPKGKKPYNQWKGLTDSHAYGAKSKMASLLDAPPSTDTSKAIDEAMLQCSAMKKLQEELINSLPK